MNSRVFFDNFDLNVVFHYYQLGLLVIDSKNVWIKCVFISNNQLPINQFETITGYMNLRNNSQRLKTQFKERGALSYS